MTNVHITILRTDSVLEQFQPDFGDYPGMFRTVLQDAAQSLDMALSLDDFDVRQGVPDVALQSVTDAYLITGSRHSVYDDLPWIEDLANFIAAALADGKKVIGICFGHQLMAHYFGGHVAPAEAGWGVGVHASRVTQQQPWMDEDSTQLALLCSHKDQVLRLPEDAQLYLSSHFCPLGGFTLGDQVITVQGHPEFTKPYAQSLMGYRRDLLGEQTYQDGIDSLRQHTDGVRAMQWMLQFVRAT